MNSKLASIDYMIFIVYFIIVSTYGIYIYRRKRKRLPIPRTFFWPRVL